MRAACHELGTMSDSRRANHDRRTVGSIAIPPFLPKTGGESPISTAADCMSAFRASLSRGSGAAMAAQSISGTMWRQ